MSEIDPLIKPSSFSVHDMFYDDGCPDQIVHAGAADISPKYRAKTSSNEFRPSAHIDTLRNELRNELKNEQSNAALRRCERLSDPNLP